MVPPPPARALPRGKQGRRARDGDCVERSRRRRFRGAGAGRRRGAACFSRPRGRRVCAGVHGCPEPERGCGWCVLVFGGGERACWSIDRSMSIDCCRCRCRSIFPQSTRSIDRSICAGCSPLSLSHTHTHTHHATKQNSRARVGESCGRGGQAQGGADAVRAAARAPARQGGLVRGGREAAAQDRAPAGCGRSRGRRVCCFAGRRRW